MGIKLLKFVLNMVFKKYTISIGEEEQNLKTLDNCGIVFKVPCIFLSQQYMLTVK